MLPVARKPIVQYVVEELVANGIHDILLVTSRNKTNIENHFDSDPQLVQTLAAQEKADLLRQIEFEVLGAHLYYTRQSEQLGLGHAILRGESFAGEQPVVVALGDSILGNNGESQSKTLGNMVELFESRRATCVIGVEEVPHEQTQHYGVIDPVDTDGSCYRIRNLVEKPSPEEAPSNLAIAGRYVFSPTIFDMIRNVKPDERGEIQLTDAVQRMCEEGRRVLAYKLPKGERRYDIGNFPSYFETFVEFALADPEFGPGFRKALERILRES